MRTRRISERIDRTGEFDAAPEKRTFDMLVREIDGQMEYAGIESPDDFADCDKTNSFLDGLRLVVKYAPGLSFLGEGSSRYAYSMGPSGRYVLKAAKNYEGLIQNQNEIAANSAGPADYDCFVRILKYDPARIFIVEDACKELPSAEWARLIGVSLPRFVQILRIVLERRESRPGYSVAELLAECEAAGSRGRSMYETFAKNAAMDDPYRPAEYDGMVSYMRNMVAAAEGKPASELWRSLYDMFRFYFDAGRDSLVLEELPWYEQWGLCGEGASRRIVLLDPGVSSDFARQFRTV